MRNYTGACRCCGQINVIASEKELEQEQIDAEATRICKCEQARKANEALANAKVAADQVRQLFGEEYMDAAEFLSQACSLIGEGKIIGASIDIDGVTKGKVSVAKNGVKVTRTESKKWEMVGEE